MPKPKKPLPAPIPYPHTPSVEDRAAMQRHLVDLFMQAFPVIQDRWFRVNQYETAAESQRPQLGTDQIGWVPKDGTELKAVSELGRKAIAEIRRDKSYDSDPTRMTRALGSAISAMKTKPKLFRPGKFKTVAVVPGSTDPMDPTRPAEAAWISTVTAAAMVRSDALKHNDPDALKFAEAYLAGGAAAAHQHVEAVWMATVTRAAASKHEVPGALSVPKEPLAGGAAAAHQHPPARPSQPRADAASQPSGPVGAVAPTPATPPAVSPPGSSSGSSSTTQWGALLARSGASPNPLATARQPTKSLPEGRRTPSPPRGPAPG